MWIFAGGMQRSASTLQYQVAAHLVESRGVGKRLPWAEVEDHEAVINEHKDEPGYLVFKTHVLTEPVREQIVAGNAKCLYSHRDIRDVISSLKAKNWLEIDGKSITDWVLELKDQYRTWQELPGLLSLSYPQLLFDLSGCVQAIATHLGIEITLAEADQIAELYSVDSQREKVRSQFGEPDKLRSVKGFKIDPESLLHENHITNPNIGRYKADLTRCEIELINVASQLYEFKSWLGDKTIKDVSDQITHLSNSNSQLNSKLDSLLGAGLDALLDSKLEDLSAKNDYILKQVQGITIHQDAALTSSEGLQSLVEELTVQYELVLQRNNELHKQINELVSQLNSAFSNENELRRQIEGLTRKRDSVSAHSNQLHDQKKDLEDRVRSLQEQVQGLQDQLHGLENLRHENNILKVLLKERTKGHLS